MTHTILVVDDDKKIVNLVALYLKNEGYQVVPAFEGEEALRQASTARPDLIILDLMLPKISGMDICRELRQVSNVPIIMLTARTTEEDKLAGLKTGADDYVTKPFSPRELVARVEAVLRRSKNGQPGQISSVVFGPLTVDFARKEALSGSETLPLTPTEYRLLEMMAREPGRCFSRRELIDSAFGFDYDGLERTIDVHIVNLRKKIQSTTGGFQPIATVTGRGYRLECSAQTENSSSPEKPRA